jgi:F-type H+-transporting ATPase subunit alpha
VHAANGDITAYLPTNIMSITDGQWILDMDLFRSGVRPAMNIGLSVTRIGGVGHNKRQKSLAAKTLKTLAAYREAEEFSHFGSELGPEAKIALQKGKNIFKVLNQGPSEIFSLYEQQLMMDIVLNSDDAVKVDVDSLKVHVREYAAKIQKDEDYDSIRDQLRTKCTIGPPPAPKPPEPTQQPETPQKSDKKDKKKVEEAKK